jgi:hypothetical protein
MLFRETDESLSFGLGGFTVQEIYFLIDGVSEGKLIIICGKLFS